MASPRDALALDDLPLDPDAAARALLLSLMARLLSPRGRVALRGADGELRTVEQRGADGELPLRFALEHGGETVGEVALATPATGRPPAPSELAVARSLVGAAAASIRAAQSAARLAEANRDLARRAREMGTLYELTRGLGQAETPQTIARHLGLTAMGAFVVRQGAVALLRGGALQTVGHWGAAAAPEVPVALLELDRPAVLQPDGEARALVEAGYVWAAPLRAGDSARGVLVLGARASGEGYGEPEAALGAAMAALAVGAMERADALRERMERERLESDVRLARAVQERLLPGALPETPGLDTAALWRPHSGVSGDAYDVSALPGGGLLVAVADVVGKGIPASLLMASLQAGVRLLRAEACDDLPAATGRLNEHVGDSTEIGQFVTLAWAVVAPDGAVKSVAAGHPAPRVLRADGRVERLGGGGPLLGVVPDAAFEASRTALSPGDALVLVSDGATEAATADGDEWGDDRLDAALSDMAGGSADAVVAGLADAIETFCDGTALCDDLTLVAVRRDPSGV